MPPLSILIWLPAAVRGARRDRSLAPESKLVLQETSTATAETGAMILDEPDASGVSGVSGGGWSTPGMLALIGSLAALGLGDRLHRRLPQPAGRPAARHRRRLDLDTGHPLQARRQRPERVPVGLTTLLFAAAVARVQPALVGAPEALLLPLHARRVGRARRLPRPGPGAVRRLLRPDADPLLLPDRRCGDHRVTRHPDRGRAKRRSSS